MDEKETLKTQASLLKAIHNDFAPIVQKIRDKMAALCVDEADREILKRLDEQLASAETLLEQIDSAAETDKDLLDKNMVKVKEISIEELEA